VKYRKRTTGDLAYMQKKKVTDRSAVYKCKVLQTKQKPSLQHHKNPYYALTPMMND